MSAFFICNKLTLSHIKLIKGFIGVEGMSITSRDRATMLGNYIVQTGATVRAAAAKYGISKSTVHKDVTAGLKEESPGLFLEVQKVLNQNKSERHIRGGMATRKKYKGI